MRRYYALVMLLVYLVFSGVAVTSGKILVASSVEGNETEAVSSSAIEHRETAAFRLADKKKDITTTNDYSYDCGEQTFDVTRITNTPPADSGVPFYVLHCIFRL